MSTSSIAPRAWRGQSKSRSAGIRPADRDRHRRSNHEAAAIILGDVDRFGGEDALSVRWARLFLLRDPVTQCGQGSLFGGAV